jgi:transcriptional regulator with XRE-family HTH domain
VRQGGQGFGATIRELREERRIGLRQFAKMIEVSATYLSKIERDELPPPAEARVKEIARLLDQDPDELLALAGKVASDLKEIVLRHPRELGALLRSVRITSRQETAHSPQSSGQEDAREGNANLIRGVGLFDTPEPGTGNALMGCPLPGNGVLVVYPGSEVCFDPGSIEVSVDDSMQLRFRARPRAAAIELKEKEVRFHPPAGDPLHRAVARVCERFGIDDKDPLALMKLIGAMVTKHYPEAFQPAGRMLSSDERAMSIAWVVDQERQDDEPSPEAIRRAKPKLLDYQLIDETVRDGTLKRLFRQGQSLLRQQDMEPWRRRAQGRPRKNSTPKHS